MLPGRGGLGGNEAVTSWAALVGLTHVAVVIAMIHRGVPAFAHRARGRLGERVRLHFRVVDDAADRGLG